MCNDKTTSEIKSVQMNKYKVDNKMFFLCNYLHLLNQVSFTVNFIYIMLMWFCEFLVGISERCENFCHLYSDLYCVLLYHTIPFIF